MSPSVEPPFSLLEVRALIRLVDLYLDPETFELFPQLWLFLLCVHRQNSLCPKRRLKGFVKSG
jgi:hypothetical protein